METKSIKLEKFKYYLTKKLYETLFESEVDLETVATFAADEILINIKYAIYGEKLNVEYISYPQDWWEGFKERWFPTWLLERYPVKYTVHTIKFMVQYPEFRPAHLGQQVLTWMVEEETRYKNELSEA